uniref:Uncharacterized protein n=2 Tax=Parascaris univalens TaxID=6257 RepID=A0A915A570_PARUN
MQRNFCKHSTDNSGCCLSMSSSPLRRENKSRRDNGTRAILRERSEFHRPTIASSAKRVPREENASLQLVPDYYPQIPGLKLTNIRAPQVRTLVHIMCDRYGDVRLEDKMEVIGDMNVRQHEMRSLKPIMKETVIAQNHRIWQPETKLDVHVARNFLCVKRVTKVRANDAPKGLRYEERKVFQSTSMHSGSVAVVKRSFYL